MAETGAAPLIFVIAGEPSGDALGGALMAALRERTGGAIHFAGIGGERMAEQGLRTLVPMRELAIHGHRRGVAARPADPSPRAGNRRYGDRDAA